MRQVLESVTNLARRPDSLLIASNFLGLGFGLVSAALQARLLGPVGRGEIALAVAPGTVIAMVMCFGLPDHFARQAAQGVNTSRLAAGAAALATAIGCVCALPYFVFVVLHTDAGTASRAVLVAYAVVSPLLVFGYCTSAMCAGTGRWSLIALSRFLPQMVTVLGLVVLTIRGTSVLVVGMLLVATAVLGALYPAFRSGLLPRGRPAAAELRQALSFGLRAWPAGSIALVNQRIDLLLLTVLAGPEDLGFYAVATTMAAVMTAVANSVAMPVRNRVIRGERAVIPAASAATAAAVLGGVLVLSLVLGPLIEVVLGPSFLPARTTMSILLVAQVPLACVVVLTQSLIGAGHPAAPLGGELAALVTTVGLVLVAYPLFGIGGAAFANLVGNLISLCVLLHLIRRVVGPVAPWRFLVPTISSFTVLRGSG